MSEDKDEGAGPALSTTQKLIDALFAALRINPEKGTFYYWVRDKSVVVILLLSLGATVYSLPLLKAARESTIPFWQPCVATFVSMVLNFGVLILFAYLSNRAPARLTDLRSALLVEDDITDQDEFAKRLKSGEPAAQFLLGKMSQETRDELAKHETGDNLKLRSALIKDLNRIIKSRSLDQLPNHPFSGKTQTAANESVQKDASETELIRLNRAALNRIFGPLICKLQLQDPIWDRSEKAVFKFKHYWTILCMLWLVMYLAQAVGHIPRHSTSVISSDDIVSANGLIKALKATNDSLATFIISNSTAIDAAIHTNVVPDATQLAAHLTDLIQNVRLSGTNQNVGPIIDEDRTVSRQKLIKAYPNAMRDSYTFLFAGKDWWQVIPDVFSAAVNIFFVFAYLQMYRPWTDEEEAARAHAHEADKEDRGMFSWQMYMIFIGLVWVLELVLVLALPEYGKSVWPYVIQIAFGLLNAITLCAFFGRMEGRFIAPPHFVIFAMYLYTALQVFACILNAASARPTLLGSELAGGIVPAKAIAYAVVFFLKALLLMFIYWLIRGGGLLFYYRNLLDLDFKQIDSNRRLLLKQFAAKRH